ncbi:MAG: hypothetical protein V2G42_04340 [bacterium JZ-2024 1]
MTLFRTLQSIDRRIIFVFLAVAVTLPLFSTIPQPVQITTEVRDFYDRIESLPEGSVVLVSFDYGPTAMPEVQPMAQALIEHVLRNNLKLVTLALWPDGEPFSIQLVDEIAQRLGKKYGEDYATLGYKPGLAAVILQMGENIHETFPQDSRGAKPADVPVLAQLKNYDDVALVVVLAAGATPDYYVAYAGERYRVRIQAGCTAVMAANFYPYLQTGQLTGLLPGLKGAQEYQFMVTSANTPKLTRMMASQSLVHLVIIFFILVGNAGYLAERYGRKPEPGAEAKP